MILGRSSFTINLDLNANHPGDFASTVFLNHPISSYFSFLILSINCCYSEKVMMGSSIGNSSKIGGTYFLPPDTLRVRLRCLRIVYTLIILLSITTSIENFFS